MAKVVITMEDVERDGVIGVDWFWSTDGTPSPDGKESMAEKAAASAGLLLYLQGMKNVEIDEAAR